MKITKLHLEYIKQKVDETLERNPNAVTIYETGNFKNSDKVKDLQMRFCFDISFASGLTPWIVEHIYPYANDDHLYTALKSVCPKINKRY